MVENGLQVINNGIQEDKDQQQVLKDLQQSFAKVGTVTFDQQSKDVYGHANNRPGCKSN